MTRSYDLETPHFRLRIVERRDSSRPPARVLDAEGLVLRESTRPLRKCRGRHADDNVVPLRAVGGGR